MTRRPAVVAIVLAVALAASALVACGIPNDSRPREIAADSPDGFGTSSQPPATLSGGTGSVTIYLIQDNVLHKVVRRTDQAPSAEVAITTLLAGATDQEIADGLASNFPPGASLRSLKVKDTVATIDLSAEMLTAVGEASTQAYAEIVFTATVYDAIQSVRFLIGGKPANVPSDNGNLEQVGRSDFRSLERAP